MTPELKLETLAYAVGEMQDIDMYEKRKEFSEYIFTILGLCPEIKVL